MILFRDHNIHFSYKNMKTTAALEGRRVSTLQPGYAVRRPAESILQQLLGQS